MKKTMLFLIAALAFTNASAQKLPNKQEASVRIPSNVKIDGKATEWDNQFQANNYSTDLLYTMANNDEELYLIIKAGDGDVINRIVDGGITLTIKNANGVNDNINITFPYTEGKQTLSFPLKVTYTKDSERPVDIVVMEYNKKLRDNHKFIKVTGVKGVDTLISLYNEKGIQANELLDEKKAYTLEIAVKLSSLGLSANKETKFSYQLKINGIRHYEPFAGKVIMAGGGEVSPEVAAQAVAEMNAKFAARYATATDFTGEYTLAK